MTGFAASPSTSSATATPPAVCPFCRSASIVTTAKKVDDDSYWRCTKCGEIWNAMRSATGSSSRRRWR
jgi:predicted Zn finger-like uncharacterized protein